MKIKFCSLSSSSSGNCHYIGTDRTKLLIDAGFSGKKIEGLLKDIDVKPEEIQGILITHEHGDHIKGAGVLSRRYNIPLYANRGTWTAMEKSIGKIHRENIKIFESENYFNIGDLDIKPVKTYHDAKEPVGYIFNKDNKKISLLTDTGKLDDRLIKSMEGSNLYLLESNHDIQMLRNGNYPEYLQNRIRSDYGHLCNRVASEALGQLVQAKGEVVLLGHISRENNSPRMAFNQTAFKLMELGIDINKDIKLELTYRDRQTECYEI